MMIKKLLILPLLGVLSIGAFASADTVDGYTSDSDITSINCSLSSCSVPSQGDYYFVVKSWSPGNDINSGSPCSLSNYSFGNLSVSSVPYISNSSVYIFSNVVSTSSATQCDGNGIVLVSSSPISVYTPPVEDDSNDEESSSSIIPGIPSSFTAGLTSMVNNFGGTLINWLPSIILVALGITAIFALFRVVRGYARGAFKG